MRRRGYLVWRWVRTSIRGKAGMVKMLTVDNFLLPDPLTGDCVRRDPEGREEHRSAVDWAHEILAVKLTDGVPGGVSSRFEIARSVLLYGFFWYPLWTHGAGEALRAGELAVEQVCSDLGAPKRAKDAEARLAWLAKRGVLESDDVSRWLALRSGVSGNGPEDLPPLVPPDAALGTLGTAAELINRLFAALPA